MKKIISAILLTQLALGPVAHARGSSFNPDQVEAAIVELYGIYDGTTITDVDKDELLEGISEEVVVLNPEGFNDVIGTLAADYHQNPGHRAAIEKMMGTCHDKISEYLRELDERHPVLTVINGVFTVWTIAYAIGFGKGLWKSRGSGLKGLARFRNAATTVAKNLPRGRRAAMAIIGAGTVLGVTQAVYQYLETKKLDPKKILTSTQTDIVTEQEQRIVVMRDELKSGGPVSRERLVQIANDTKDAKSQLDHLKEAAPNLNGKMETGYEDINTVNGLLAKAGLRLDGGDITGGMLP